MKMLSHHGVRLLALAGLMISAVPAGAQDAPDGQKQTVTKLVDVSGLKASVQKTPDFALKGGTTDKRWKPKDWIEIESTLKVDPPKSDSKAEVISDLKIDYYVFLAAGAGKEPKVLTGSVMHTNVPVKETVHSVMFVSPSTIFKATGKPEGNPNLVTMIGVEITMGGDLVGKHAVGGPVDWWKSPKAPKSEAALLNKLETPFAPLWGDYHLDVKAK